MPGFDTGFKNHELTAAITLSPYLPGRIGRMGLFQEEGVARTHVDIEYAQEILSLIQTQERGSRKGALVPDGKRTMYSFRIPHLPQEAVIRPDDLPDVRAFGTKDGYVSMKQVVKNKLKAMRQNFEATFEFHRMGAINGVIMNPDGTEIHNLFDIYDITQKEMAVDFSGTDSNAIKKIATEIVPYLQDKLGSTPYGSIVVLCGDEFFRNLILLEEVKDAYNRPKDGQFLRDNQMRDGFEYAGIWWENYRGKVGSVEFLASDEARVIPTGVPGLFIRRNGPDDTMDGVGQLGRSIVVTQERMPHGGGIELRGQANPLFLCTRPSALIKLTTAAAPPSST